MMVHGMAISMITRVNKAERNQSFEARHTFSRPLIHQVLYNKMFISINVTERTFYSPENPLQESEKLFQKSKFHLKSSISLFHCKQSDVDISHSLSRAFYKFHSFEELKFRSFYMISSDYVCLFFVLFCFVFCCCFVCLFFLFEKNTLSL